MEPSWKKANRQMVANRAARRIILTCTYCTESFSVSPYYSGRRFCSAKCSHLSQRKGRGQICKTCKEGYYRPPSQIKWRGSNYCSQVCKFKGYAMFMSREKSPSWQGGKTSENRLVRGSSAWRGWRQQVFERDDYTCQDCGIRGGYLEPHHIKPFAFFPELRFEVGNGMTLCKPCHKNTDTWGERAKKYASQEV